MELRDKLLLLYLAETSDKQLSSFLKIADRKQILAIKEVSLNLLLGNLTVTEEEKRYCISGYFRVELIFAIFASECKPRNLILANIFKDMALTNPNN